MVCGNSHRHCVSRCAYGTTNNVGTFVISGAFMVCAFMGAVSKQSATAQPVQTLRPRRPISRKRKEYESWVKRIRKSHPFAGQQVAHLIWNSLKGEKTRHVQDLPGLDCSEQEFETVLPAQKLFRAATRD